MSRRALRPIIDGQTEYLPPELLLKRWGNVITMGTLRNWRSRGKGPPWTKLERRVVYPLDSLIEWEQSNTVGEEPNNER